MVDEEKKTRECLHEKLELNPVSRTRNIIQPATLISWASISTDCKMTKHSGPLE